MIIEPFYACMGSEFSPKKRYTEAPGLVLVDVSQSIRRTALRWHDSGSLGSYASGKPKQGQISAFQPLKICYASIRCQ